MPDSFHCWGKSGPRSRGPDSKARPPTFCSTDFMCRKTGARMLVAHRPPAVRWESHEGRFWLVGDVTELTRLRDPMGFGCSPSLQLPEIRRELCVSRFP